LAGPALRRCNDPAVRVIVVGGGVVGLCCAYELARAGADVAVLERGRLGEGASRGNTGWVTPSFTYPLPAPGVIGQGLRALLRGSGPLVIHPSLDPAFVRWLWQFRRSCSRARWERGVRALLALNARTTELYDGYAAAGVVFEMHASGLVVAARSAAGLEPYRALFRELAALGFSGEIGELGGTDVRALEPALGPRVSCGLHARVDRHVRPESLIAGLAAHLATAGVELHEGTDVRGVTASGGGVRVETRSGPFPADRAVVAAGAGSAALLEALGVRVPLVGGKGYSVTLAGGGARPRHALYLAEAKVGVSAYRDSVRIAGVFELGRRDVEAGERRLAAMLATVEPYFEAWRPAAERRLLGWAGLRPTTPDGLPLIGAAPSTEGVYVATGHGMLGVTLAPSTAALLAPLVLEGRDDPVLEPFRPGRAV
jgi:D-amino-acid dehydrogenase